MLPKEDKTLKRESKSDLKNLKNKRNDRNYLNLILNISFTYYQTIFNKLILVKTNGNYLMILQQSLNILLKVRMKLFYNKNNIFYYKYK